MWVLTTDVCLVNVREARKIVVEVEPQGKPHTRLVLAYYSDGDTAVLARVHQADESYARALTSACVKAINDALRDGHHFCDLSGTVSQL